MLTTSSASSTWRTCSTSAVNIKTGRRFLCLLRIIATHGVRALLTMSTSLPQKAPENAYSTIKKPPLAREEACRTAKMATSTGKRLVARSEWRLRSGAEDLRRAITVLGENRWHFGRAQSCLRRQEGLATVPKVPRLAENSFLTVPKVRGVSENGFPTVPKVWGRRYSRSGAQQDSPRW